MKYLMMKQQKLPVALHFIFNEYFPMYLAFHYQNIFDAEE